MTISKLAAVLTAIILGTGAHALAQTGTPISNAPATGVPTSPAQAQTASVVGPIKIPELIDRLSAQGYSDISEVERKSDKLYEVKARDSQGRKLEMHVDARTAEVLHSEQD